MGHDKGTGKGDKFGGKKVMPVWGKARDSKPASPTAARAKRRDSARLISVSRASPRPKEKAKVRPKEAGILQ